MFIEPSPYPPDRNSRPHTIEAFHRLIQKLIAMYQNKSPAIKDTRQSAERDGLTPACMGKVCEQTGVKKH
jgi:hypothetical protein